MKKILIEKLNENKGEYIEYLKKLISINTEVIGHGIQGGKEKDGQVFIKSVLEELGAKVKIEEIEEENIEKANRLYNEGNTGHNYKDRFNLIGEFQGEGSQTILFNGHVDTMPPGDIKRWHSNPWEPKESNGKLYGLGAADMKSGLMASIMAVKLIKDCGLPLRNNVKILSVVDEEGGGNGTINAAMNGIKADAAVVCEPSDNKIIRAHMGFVFFNIEVSGIALHSGKKWEGVNAIEKAIKVIGALHDLEHMWLMKYKHLVLPAPTINIGVIEGGTAGSTVPDKCTFKICIHYIPGAMSYGMVKQQVIDVINNCAQGDEYLREHRPKYSIYQAGGPFEMEESHQLINTASKIYENIIGKDAEVQGSCAGNDARILKNILGIPTIIWGPGALEQCHSIDEYVSIDEYLKFILMYSELILNYET